MFGEAPSLVQFGRQPMAAAELSTQQAHRSRSEGAVGTVLRIALVTDQPLYREGMQLAFGEAGSLILLPNSVWCYGDGNVTGASMPPFLIKGRYGEPILARVYNNTPVNREENNGFGRNEQQLHFHNAHNASESDGATGCHHFPGTFYDYLWSTTLARRDKINTDASDRRASGPDGNGGLVKVPGDFREIQGTTWAHDHRFFFTAENVYKGNLAAMINFYSGPDRARHWRVMQTMRPSVRSWRGAAWRRALEDEQEVDG